MPPRPQGTVHEQLERQYAYLYQMAQQLNLAMEQLPAAPVGAVPPVGKTASEAAEQYGTLKSLILRTATEVRREMDSLQTALAGTYVAASDFGTYLEELNSRIEADPAAITQYYSFVSDLQMNMEAVSAAFESYRAQTEGYIRTGIVYYEGATPVYGVAVGQNLTVHQVDGETVVEPGNFRATYTASKLSFWQDETEVAYVSNNRLYIGNITVLSAVVLGRWELSDRGGLSIKWMGG